MKIAIAGFGIEGQENLRFFRKKFPDAQFKIFDERKLDLENYGGDFSEIHGFDLVLRSPSLAPKKIPRDNKEISSSTNYFFANCPAKIIGVTGSKGKGTTCSFTAEILREYFKETSELNHEKQVFLLGNIGIPALSELEKIRENDVVIYELSSFQLWDIKHSPQFAGVTIIEPDHLNIHDDFMDYVTAKTNIFSHQNASDFAIYNRNDKKTCEMAGSSAGEKIAYPNEDFANVLNGNICIGNCEIMNKNELKLPGEHNIKNALLALDLAFLFAKNSINFNKEKFIISAKNGLKKFAGLDHRLKFVIEKNGAKFYDDSIATTTGSVTAAIKTFYDDSKILIMGGSDKGGDYSDLGEIIRENGRVKIIVTMGENAEKITGAILPKIDSSVTEIIEFKLEELTKDDNPFVRILAKIKPKITAGDTVILSPAAASFDLFSNYGERGDKFVDAVNEL